MNKNIYIKTFLFVLMAWTFQPAFAENVSFKFSFNTNNIQRGDLFTSTESFNTLRQDWKNSKGGSLNGRFDPITYGYNYELELRIPIFSGFALNLGGSRLKSTSEGTIDFEQTGGTQTETHSLKNDILVYPFKIGFSYLFRLPFFSNLSIGIGVGRLIIFSKYETFDGIDENGKASLHFYESNQWDLGNHYLILMGHKDRPDSEDIRNIRQGELNFSGYSFKVGIRFIF